MERIVSITNFMGFPNVLRGIIWRYLLNVSSLDKCKFYFNKKLTRYQKGRVYRTATIKLHIINSTKNILKLLKI
jgi:hypothetical protein